MFRKLQHLTTMLLDNYVYRDFLDVTFISELQLSTNFKSCAPIAAVIIQGVAETNFVFLIN